MLDWPSRTFFHLRVATEGGSELLLPIYVHISQQHASWFNEKRDEIIPSVLALVCEAISDIEMEAKREESLTAATLVAPPGTPNRLAGCPLCLVAYTTAKRSKYDVVSLATDSSQRSASLRVSSFSLKLFLFPTDSELTDVNPVFL